MRPIRIGMLTPSSNTVLEPALAQMAADMPGLSLHVSRFRVTQISLDEAALGRFAFYPMVAVADPLSDAEVAPALERELGIPVLVAVTRGAARRFVGAGPAPLARWERLFARGVSPA